MEKKLETLALIAGLLNEQNITWALGASCMLYLRGFNVKVDDIDIRVTEKDYDKVKELLLQKGFVKEVLPNKKFRTTHFSKLEINEVKVDIMAGFKVVKDGKLYNFPIEDNKIFDSIKVFDQNVYLDSVIDWYDIYKKMERTSKVALLEEFFLDN